MILHTVSAFLRNYFFLLAASGKKLFRKKTFQTALGRFEISQMRRFAFHLTSLRYSDRHVIQTGNFQSFIHYPHRICLSHVNNY